jgi:hypothetical protein
MRNSFIRSLKRKRIGDFTLSISDFEDQFELSLRNEKHSPKSPFPKKRDNRNVIDQSPNGFIKVNTMSILLDEIIILICCYVRSLEDVYHLQLLNTHWFHVIKEHVLLETEKIYVFNPVRGSTGDRKERTESNSEQKQNRKITYQKNQYEYIRNKPFLRRYSSRKRLEFVNKSHDVIDLTQNEEIHLSQQFVESNTFNTICGPDEYNSLSIEVYDNEGNVEECNQPMILEESDTDLASDITTTTAAAAALMNTTRDETVLLSDSEILTTPKKQPEQISPEDFKRILSSVITLRFDNFFIQLTDPLWTLILIDTKKVYELDPNKPIFSASHFLKILRFFKSNKWKLTSSRVSSLVELFYLLKPFSSVFFSSEREIEYFIYEAKSIVIPSKEQIFMMSNLTFLTTQYIHQYKHWFEDDTAKLPDFLKLASSFECIDSHARMPRLIQCRNLQNNYNFELNCRDFHIYDTLFCYPNSEIISDCIDSLSVFSFPYDGGNYYGDINNENGLPDGYGSWISENKTERFDGYWVNGMKCGEGKYISDWFIYTGEWMYDQFEGEGELLFTIGKHKGSLYKGKFEKGKKHGEGIQYYRISKEEEESISNENLDLTVDREKDGKETLINDENGKQYHAWYRGEWVNDERCGYGEFRTSNSWKYGQWKRDELLEGIGIITDRSNNLKYSIVIQNFHIVSRKCVVSSKFLASIQEDEEESEPQDMDIKKIDSSLLSDYNVVSGSSSLYTPKRSLWNGYCLRSRLEARWAIFLEYLSIDYVYEPRTFQLSNGHKYTPDFYLPNRKMWLEIKPCYPTELEIEKVKLLSQIPSLKGHRILLIYGSVNPPFVKKFYEGAKGIEFFGHNPQREPMAWSQCSICKRFDIGLRCDPPCHPNANAGSVKPSIHLQMAYEYANKIDFDQLNKSQREAAIGDRSTPWKSKYF